MTTLVTVGNATQPFSRFLEAVPLLAPQLPPPIVVQFGHTVFTPLAGIAARQFLTMDEFERLLCEASLVLTHAGAGTVISALQAGKTPVVMPRQSARGEHVDDHQLEFARELEKMGRVVVAVETSELDKAIDRAMKIQSSASASPHPALVSLVADRIQKYLQ